jgi:putative flippase GtrA
VTLLSRIKHQVLDLFSYLWIAVVGTAVNLGSRILYEDKLHIPFQRSVALAYITGAIVGFTLSKLFAFKQRTSENAFREATKFFMVTGLAFSITYMATLTVFATMDSYLQVHPNVELKFKLASSITGYRFIDRKTLSHVIGIGLGFFANFFGHKFITFRDTGTWNWIEQRRKANIN